MSRWSDFTVQTLQKPQKDEFADSNRASVIFQLMQKDAPQCKWIISTNKQQNKQTDPILQTVYIFFFSYRVPFRKKIINFLPVSTLIILFIFFNVSILSLCTLYSYQFELSLQREGDQFSLINMKIYAERCFAISK